MKLKIHEIADFPAFFSKFKNQKLPFKTSYKLTLLFQEISKHVDFYQEKFRELLLEYSEKDESGSPVPTADGQGVVLKQDSANEAYTKLAELRDLDVELSDTKFLIDDFGNIELTPEEMAILMPFIEG